MDPDGPQHQPPYWLTISTPADHSTGGHKTTGVLPLGGGNLRCRDVLGLRSGRGSCFHPEGVQEKGGYGWVRARFAIPANGSSRLVMFCSPQLSCEFKHTVKWDIKHCSDEGGYHSTPDLRTPILVQHRGGRDPPQDFCSFSALLCFLSSHHEAGGGPSSVLD